MKPSRFPSSPRADTAEFPPPPTKPRGDGTRLTAVGRARPNAAGQERTLLAHLQSGPWSHSRRAQTAPLGGHSDPPLAHQLGKPVNAGRRRHRHRHLAKRGRAPRRAAQAGTLRRSWLIAQRQNSCAAMPTPPAPRPRSHRAFPEARHGRYRPRLAASRGTAARCRAACRPALGRVLPVIARESSH